MNIASILLILQLAVSLITTVNANPSSTQEQREVAGRYAEYAITLAVDEIKQSQKTSSLPLSESIIQAPIIVPEIPTVVLPEPAESCKHGRRLPDSIISSLPSDIQKTNSMYQCHWYLNTYMPEYKFDAMSGAQY